MQKEISFEFEGQKYTLTFTRKTVQLMDRSGFNPDDVTAHPATGVPALFRGAFLANHKWVKADLIDRMFEKIPNMNDLVPKLMVMYYEPINEMLEGKEDDPEKNLEWGANF